MLRQCAWCGCILGYTDAPDIAGTTHGMCLPCSVNVLHEAEQAAATGDHGMAATAPSPLPLPNSPRGRGVGVRGAEERQHIDAFVLAVPAVR